LRDPLIAVVTAQTEMVLSLFTTDFIVVAGNNFPDYINLAEPNQSHTKSFVFRDPNIVYTIQLACTGLGSIAIFGGLVAAVQAPFRRKLKALAAAVGIIYVLNIARNVFIAYTFGTQKLQVLPDLVVSVFALTHVEKVSYIVADRIIAQFLSVVALVGITYVVVMQLPEVVAIVEEMLYVVTRKEYDLQRAMGVGARTDGGQSDQE
jgi:archaeosortase A (PGF-CTERM-specific)